MKTFLMKKQDVQRKWWLLDANGQVLGRMATQIALVLMGKHQPTYTPHVDCGDTVVVINAEKVKITGSKTEQREFDYYTHYPGGHKYKSLAEMLRTKPEKVIEMAVKRMLPKNKLGRHMIMRLKVVRGDRHKYETQKPEKMAV
jgi:large subunit ribosomal protein L13